MKEKVENKEIKQKDTYTKESKKKKKKYSNRKDLLMIEICNVEKNEFKDYINKKVQDAGYKVDLEYVDWDNVYGAYDNEGYNIRIIYDNKDKEMHITLSAPEKMENIEWPNTGLGSLLPIPKSLYANISWNNSETFIVHIGNTPLEEYNNYVKECENKIKAQLNESSNEAQKCVCTLGIEKERERGRGRERERERQRDREGETEG